MVHWRRDGLLAANMWFNPRVPDDSCFALVPLSLEHTLTFHKEVVVQEVVVMLEGLGFLECTCIESSCVALKSLGLGQAGVGVKSSSSAWRSFGWHFFSYRIVLYNGSMFTPNGSMFPLHFAPTVPHPSRT